MKTWLFECEHNSSGYCGHALKEGESFIQCRIPCGKKFFLIDNGTVIRPQPDLVRQVGATLVSASAVFNPEKGEYPLDRTISANIFAEIGDFTDISPDFGEKTEVTIYYPSHEADRPF